MNVLAVARDALATGPLCDVCLGRLVADRSFGLANADRGHSLRVAVVLADDDPFEPPESPCWVCEDECGAERYDTWAERTAAALRGYEFATYQVGTSVPPLLAENDALLREDVGLDEAAGDGIKSELNREVGKRLGTLTDAEVEFERPDVQVVLDLATEAVDVQVNSAFVYGRYRKLERDIPQTEWPCTACNATGINRGEDCRECGGTGYRYDESVEELTAPVVREAMDGEAAVFHGAGREDVDARMLGEGRPFVIEVTEPRRRTVDTEALTAEIDDFADGAVAVEGLRTATYEMVERVKELDASKRYRMTVSFDEPVTAGAFGDALSAVGGATIHQETPQRVDHRRASKTRTRQVYDADGELLGSPPATQATVEVHGEGGLYVKELVSGDEGRTEPSLAGRLGVGARVTALDVLAVTGEDDPFEDPDYFRPGVDVDDPGAGTSG
jgi:tRNA pseudouridine synthase 10